MTPPASSSRVGTPFRMGDWLVEPLRNQIIGPDGSTRVEPRVMRLFTVLAERAPGVVSREVLTQEVWQGTFVSDEVLTQSISELRKALGDDPREPRFIVTVPKRGYQLVVEPEPEPPRTRERGRIPKERIAWALLTAVLLIGLIGLYRSTRPPLPRQPIRYAIEAPPATSTETLEISPDGTRLAFIAPDADGAVRVWIHDLETGRRKPLPGTEGAWHLFWSPDGRFIGFSTVSSLKKIDILDGFVQTVRNNGFLWGGSWSRSAMLLAHFGQLYRVDAAGGEPHRVPPEGRVESIPFGIRPHFLPDGEHFLFFSAPELASGRIFVGSFDSEETEFLLESDSKAIYADGYLLYVRSGALLAQRFYPERLRLEGDPQVLGQQLISPAIVRRTDTPFSASRNGVLAFRGTAGVDGQLVWFDREGTELGRVPQPTSGEYVNPRLSPDGRWIGANRKDPATGDVDIWLIDAETNVASRFTSTPSPESDPVWSPDGRRVAFASTRDDRPGVYVKEVAGGEEKLLWQPVQSRGGLLLTDWSRDGRFLLCFTGGDTWKIPVEEQEQPQVILRDEFEPGSGVRTIHVYTARFSPDGEWIAYTSNETGSFEVYVMRASDGRDRQRISNAGGVHPTWRSDGQELFYWGGTDLVGPLMRVEIQSEPSGLRASAPVRVFEPPIAALFDSRNNYDVAKDGERFLLRRPSRDRSPITILVNWSSLLADR